MNSENLKAEIWQCSIRFGIKTHRNKDVVMTQPEKLILTLIGSDVQYKEYLMQQKHNSTFTDSVKSKITHIELLSKISNFGTPVHDVHSDRRNFISYNGFKTHK